MFHKNKQADKTERRRPLVNIGEQRSTSSVFSYHAASRNARPSTGNASRDMKALQKEAQETSVAARSGKQINWRRHGSVILILTLVGLFLLSSLFVGTQPLIIEDGDGRGQIFLRNTSIYQEAASQLLSSSSANHFKPMIDTAGISQKLSDEFPELAGVSITIPVFGHEPTVHIQPATPGLVLSTLSGQSYVVDTTGLALITTAQAPNIGALHLPVVSDQSGLVLTPGQLALPTSSTAFITEVVGQVRAAGIIISSLTLPKGSAEMDLRANGIPYAVKFNLEGNARVEAGTFLAVKAQLQRESVTPASYLDVRVEGRAYYK